MDCGSSTPNPPAKNYILISGGLYISLKPRGYFIKN